MGETNPKNEFRDLLKLSGWSQAEAARQLAMTPSALSQIVRKNSKVRPSPVTLRLFSLLIRRQPPAAGARGRSIARDGGARRWEWELIRALRRIPANTRKPVLEVLYAMIKAAQLRSPNRPRRGLRNVRKQGSSGKSRQI